MRLTLAIVFSLFLICFLSGCNQPDRLKRIKERGELVVVTRNAPTTYYEYRDRPAGFEYELVTAFAKHLDVKPRFILKDNITEILKAIESGEADIAAAGITHTRQRDALFLFSIPYQMVTQEVVCRRPGPCPGSMGDLEAVTLVIPANTSYEERLKELKIEFPFLKWESDPQLSTENLLEKVWLKKIQCTVADSNILAINRRYYPELEVCFDLSRPQPIAWAMPKDANSLRKAVNKWLAVYMASDDFTGLLDKYYGYVKIFDYVDVRRFLRHIKTRLPRYRELFEKAAKSYGFDWTLLAAMAYQESHWNRYAKSPTGVRGIMMLTLTTARELGITSRLDPKQSIMGGARYLTMLRKRIPESVKEPDRDWMTLAAYNVGFGHLMDARELARRLGKNPDLWPELAEVFPLLSRKKYYKTLKHGYARGWEPVLYVQRIRNYRDILQRHLRQS